MTPAARRRTIPPPPTGVIVVRVVRDHCDPPPARSAHRDWRSVATSAGRAVGRGVLGAVLVAIVAGIAVLSGNGGVANAEISPCIDDPTYNTYGPEQVRGGIDGMIAQTGPKGTYDSDDALPQGSYTQLRDAIEDTTYTDYEKLGTSGALWSVDYGSQDEDDNACFPIDKVVGNFVANLVFNGAKLISRVAISTYQWATSDGLLDPLNDPIDDTVAAMWDGGIGSLVGVVIVLGLGTITWLTLGRKRASAGVGGIIWMVIALAGLLLFVIKPSGIATAADGFVRDATTFAMSSLSTSTENADPHVEQTYDAIREEENAGQRIASDMLWRTLIFTPWLSGQYGTASAEPIYMLTDPVTPPDTPEGIYDGTIDARYLQLYSQACVLDPGIPCEQFDPATPVPDEVPGYYQYSVGWYLVENWTCTSADHCIGPVGNPDGGDNDDDREVNSSNGWQYRAVWSGDQPGQRMMAAFTAMVANLALGSLIFVFAAMVIAYALVMRIMLLLGPFILLLGIEPTFGRRLVMSFAGFLGGTVLKRIGTGLLLSVLIVFFQIIMASSFNWFAQIGLMIGLAVAALLIRAPLSTALASFAPAAGAFAGSDDQATSKITERTKSGAQKAGGTTRRAGAKSITAPLTARRAFAGARAGRDAAKDRIRTARMNGQEITAGQERRAVRSGIKHGAEIGKNARNRFDAERHAGAVVDRDTRARTTAYDAADRRRFGRTEHGRASKEADKVRLAASAAAAQQQRLAKNDENVRIAAAASPAKFRGTPRNFDGYDQETGKPRYVDRNSKAKPPQRKHAAGASNVPLRGADPLPRPHHTAPKRTISSSRRSVRQ